MIGVLHHLRFYSYYVRNYGDGIVHSFTEFLNSVERSQCFAVVSLYSATLLEVFAKTKRLWGLWGLVGEDYTICKQEYFDVFLDE